MARLLAGRYDELAVGLLLGLAATVACLAVWAWCRRFRRRPAVSVWFVKPRIGVSGKASATSSGSTRAMSAITRSGGSALSTVMK